MHGANDAAVIGFAQGADTSVTEDESAITLTASGKLTISDADHDQAFFQTAVTKGAGAWGNLTLDASGNYSYSVANSATQGLGAGQTHTDTFTVKALDGTTHEVSFTVNGQDEAQTGTVVDFEDVTTGYVPVTYAGFHWDTPAGEYLGYGVPVDTGLVMGGPGGPADGGNSPDGTRYVWTNGGIDPVIITRADGDDFFFESLLVSTHRASDVTLSGYNNGHLVGEVTHSFPDGDVGVTMTADWGAIDTLVLNASTNPNVGFDDLTYSLA
ncbi:VCBS domain-containing protein [Rubellimicrobium mesophilum]|uniref:VCBS domain-containing protein n=1 Tax=Rubellimicrobium mesophilum TaxID=1123067 RepID=UPI001FDF033E|nr:VCBS domain-containing protein [Rubellimicrobium mesophilum]